MEEEIDRQCAVCSHPDSYADRSSYLESGALELTLIDPEESHPDVESTRNVNPEESSLMWRTSTALIKKNSPFMTPLQLRRCLPLL